MDGLQASLRIFCVSSGSDLTTTGIWDSQAPVSYTHLITRTDSGHNTFNYGEILGSGMGAAISTYSYHPAADQTFSNTASVWGTQVAYDAIRIVLNEFWPDIRRHYHKDKTQPQP